MADPTPADPATPPILALSLQETQPPQDLSSSDPNGADTPGRASSWPANQFFSEIDISNCLSLLEVREMFIEYRLQKNGITLRLDAAGSQLGNAHLKFPSQLRTGLAQKNLEKYKLLLAEHEARSPRSPRSPPGTPRNGPPGIAKKTSARNLLSSPRTDLLSDSVGSKKGVSEGSLYIPPQLRKEVNKVGVQQSPQGAGLSRSTGVARSYSDTRTADEGAATHITLHRSAGATTHRHAMGIRKAASDMNLRDRVHQPSPLNADTDTDWKKHKSPVSINHSASPRAPSPSPGDNKDQGPIITVETSRPIQLSRSTPSRNTNHQPPVKCKSSSNVTQQHHHHQYPTTSTGVLPNVNEPKQ